MRKPSLHQQPGRRELRCERHRPVQPIQDSNGERGAGADEPLRIHVEAAGIRHGHGQFAQYGLPTAPEDMLTDGPNVRRVLEESLPANLTLMMTATGEYRLMD